MSLGELFSADLAFRAVRDTVPPPPTLLASALQLMGHMRAQFRQYDESVAAFEEAILILRQNYPADATVVLTCLQEYCAVLEKAGRKAEARRVREMFRSGVESWRVAVPEAGPAGV